MSVTRTGQITVSVPARPKAGIVSGAWAARAHTVPWSAAVLGHPWAASALGLGLHPTLALTSAAAAASSVAVSRRARSKHRDRMREHGLRRGKLGKLYPIDAPLPSPEGVFRLGVMTEPGPRGDHELRWCPWDGDAPNFMAAGSTGGGKTELVRLMLCHALGWGWDAEVIDLKGSTEYHPLEVHDTPAAARDCLARVMADLRRRGELLRSVGIPVEDSDGQVYRGRARNFRDVPAELRGEFRHRLVVVDEEALLLLPGVGGDKGLEAGRKAIGFLQAATALVRSLGIHIVLAVQRPDADLLPGFTKNNLQARCLLGRNDDEAQRMVLTNAVASEAIELSDVTDRPPGRLVAVGVGGPGAVLGHAYRLHPAALLRAAAARADSQPAPPAAASPGPQLVAVPDAPEPSVALGSGPASSPSASARPGVGNFVPPPAALGSGSSAAPSPGLRRPRSLRPPLARAALRASAWRLLVGPGPRVTSERPDGIRAATLERAGSRCAACGDLAGPHHVDHRRPRQFGGSDRARNLWVLCVKCHAAKTAEEVVVRRTRARLSPRALARGARGVPGWAWVLVAAMGLGAFAPPLVAGVAGVLLVAQGLHVLFRKSGLDGLPTMDARLEVFYGGPIGRAARARTMLFAGVGTLRLYAGAFGAAVLLGLLVRWWLGY